MKDIFRDILKGKVVIVGVGNTMRSDDGFGPRLIKKLKGKVSAEFIDAGTSPENYVGKIKSLKPDTILIADVIHLNKNAGEYEILKKSDIVKGGLSTHDISLSLFLDYLESQTSPDIYVLGMQPGSLSFGEDISGEVKNGIDKIVNLLVKQKKEGV